MVNYKKIGDILTDSELNAYASLIAHNKVLKDSFKLKNGVINGVYGDYEFDLSNASIVDNGILITDETLSNNITVKLSNATQYATYTLHFTVVRYGDVNILEEPTENIESFDLSVDLITDTTINIPLTDLQEYDVILFQSNITITHNKPEITGKYITHLDITGNKPIIQPSETSTLEITATDLEHLPMPNKEIQLLKNNTLLDTLTTDSQGKCSYTYTGIGAGKQDFIAKYRGLQSETYEVTDCQYIDYGTINNHQTWKNESSSTFTRTDTACTIKTSSPLFPRIEKTITGDFEAVFYASMTNAIRIALYDASNSNNQILWIMNQSDEVLFRIRRIGTEWTVQHSTDDGATWSANYTKLSGSITDEDVYFGFVISTSNERSITYHDLRVYPI